MRRQLPILIATVNINNVTSSLMQNSSCVGNIDPIEYIFYANDPNGVNNPGGPAYAYAPNAPTPGFVYINIAPISFFGGSTGGTINWNYFNWSPIVEMHETGHAFGGLFDEYIDDKYGSLWNASARMNHASPANCTSNPKRDYRSPVDNLIYGSVSDVGCLYVYYRGVLSLGLPGINYYRPSVTGIMNTADDGEGNLKAPFEFNVIDCGYIVARIQGVPYGQLTPKNVGQYWPLCKAMAQQGTVISDDIPPAIPAPIINNGISSGGMNEDVGSSNAEDESFIVLTPGDPTVTGIGFTPTGNSVQFTDVTDSTKTYEVNDISSPNGKTLTFTMPTDDPIPAGTYQLRTGAFNSPWSNFITVTVLGSDLSSLSPSLATPNAPVTVTGIDLPTQPTSKPVVMAFFQNGRQVTTVPVTLVSSSTLRFNPPQNVAAGNFTVALAYNPSAQLNGPTTQISNSLPFTVAGNSAPTASSCPAGYTCTYTATSTKISNVVPALVSGKLPTSAVLAPPAVTASNVAAPLSFHPGLYKSDSRSAGRYLDRLRLQLSQLCFPQPLHLRLVGDVRRQGQQYRARLRGDSLHGAFSQRRQLLRRRHRLRPVRAK